MNEMSGAIERETVLCKRAAKSADSIFLFDQDRIVLRKMESGANARKASADNDDTFASHDHISTFMRRYADKPAAEIVPPNVATAHSRLTWLMRIAIPLKS